MNTDDFKTEGEFDLYVKGAWDERARIIELLKQEFGEDYYDMGVVGRIVALIRGEI
jgi:hypothetical protein